MSSRLPIATSRSLMIQPNHLLSAAPIFLKLFFHNTPDLQQIKREILPLALSNSAKLTAVDAYADVVGMSAEAVFGDEDEGKAWGADENEKKKREREPAECIVDIREHDIPYYLRVAIDLGEFRVTVAVADQ